MGLVNQRFHKQLAVPLWVVSALLAGLSATVGCSQSASPAPSPTPCLPLAQPLQAEELYPVVNATGVPDNTSVIVYEQYFGSTQLPIAIAAGTQSPIPLQPTSVPSPEPTPFSQPAMGATLYAAALPSLAPATNYNVYGYEYGFAGSHGLCSFPAGYASVIGSFTTQ